jgi:nucleotide-binding universal stress UspA family protein
MSKRILVPLNGHEADEAIAPVVAALASQSGASVRLLWVSAVPERVVGPYGRTIAYVDQEMARVTANGLDGLAPVAAQFGGVPVESVVRFGEPVEEILLEAEAFDADLIALAAPPRSRWRALFSSGVAEQVMRKAPVPVLTLRV